MLVGCVSRQLLGVGAPAVRPPWGWDGGKLGRLWSHLFLASLWSRRDVLLQMETAVSTSQQSGL